MTLEQRLTALAQAIALDIVALGNRYRSFVLVFTRSGFERVALHSTGFPIVLRDGSTAIVPLVNEQLPVILKDGTTVYLSTY